MNQTELRALIARMQEQVTRVGAKSSPEDRGALTDAWDSLNSHLNVGPAPDTRPCPNCQKTIMRAATVCGFCWTKLNHGSAS